MLEPDELSAVEAHLRDCAECRMQLECMAGEVVELGAVRVDGPQVSLPRRSAGWQWGSNYLRAAAVFIISLGVGSFVLRPYWQPPANVLPATDNTRPLADSSAHALSDDTEVRLF